MGKRIISIIITVLLGVIALSSCTAQRTPVQATSALNSNLSPVCEPGPINSTGGVMYTFPENGIVNSQAEYEAAYHGWAPAGSPTPTPEPIDFTKKTLIVTSLYHSCGTSASITGLSTDCSTVFVNISRTSDCGTIHCNSTSGFMVSFLIDKTTLPVMRKTNTTLCDGSVVTDIGPLK